MNEISVYPNPVTDKLFINPGKNTGKLKVEFITMGGNVLFMRSILNESFIDVSSLAPSVYMLRLSQGDESITMRIVKN
jgi:hypothetical protein